MTFMYIPYDPPYCADEDGCGSGPVDLSAYEGFVSLTAPEEAGTISFATGIEGGTQILMQSGNIGITAGNDDFGQLELEAGTISLDSAGITICTNEEQFLGFHGADPIPQQTGVAVTAEAIHAALVALGLITA